jgi:hypothetical protein
LSDPLIPGGCILLARKIIESEIWEKPPLYLKVWLHLLLKAQHSNYKNLKRGQLIISIPDIMDEVAWKVGARKVKPSKDQVFQVIDWLRKASSKATTPGYESNARATPEATMITTAKATQKILININKYRDYQDFKSYESNADSNAESTDEKATGKPESEEAPDNINKNGSSFNKNEQDKDISAEIFNFRSRYTPEFLIVIDSYLEFIAGTRKGKKIGDGITLKIFQQFSRYSLVRVEYAIKTHMGNMEYSKAREEYTFGIARNTTEEEVVRKLANNQIVQWGQNGGRGNSASERLAETTDREIKKIQELMASERDRNQTIILNNP